MKGKNIITMNGRQYDALTGMPLQQAPQPAAPSSSPAATAAPKPTMPAAPAARPQPKPRVFSDFTAPARPAAKPATPAAAAMPKHPAVARPSTPPAHAVHQKPQRSHTLYRGALKKPVVQKATAPQVEPAHSQPPQPQQPLVPPAKPPVHRSPTISKFGSLYDNAAASPAPAEPAATEAPQQPKVHPAVAKAITNLQQKKQAQNTEAQPAAQSSKDLKESLIKERLAQVDASEKAVKAKKRGLLASPKRLTTVLTSTLAILLLAGYLTYINLPNISMRVAATRAGVSAANFPNYKPDGYSFAGPITYSPGEIAINFKSNTNDQGYTVKQKSSNWDSQAVLDNFVTKYTDSYLTYQERGLTIYSFDDKAAWVNGGLLYTIEGNAKLTGEQVLRIATSM